MTSALPQFWHDWRRSHRGALIAAGWPPEVAQLLAEVEAKSRAAVERHAGREAAVAAIFTPGDTPRSGRLMIDSHLVPPERRAAAKAALGLPANY